MNDYRQTTAADFLRLIEKGVSNDRLASYRRNARTVGEGLAYYAWNTARCEALYPSLRAFEIALRNSLHAALSEKAGTSQWYTQAAAILRESEMDEVAVARQTLEKQHKPVTPPGIVAELNFGFWASLFDRRYERVLWPQRARAVFPHALAADLPRDRLSSRINRIRRLRNRVFHFEPLWHWDDLPAHHAYVGESTGMINPACRAVAELFDRFPEVHAAGMQPYRETISGFLSDLFQNEISA